MLRFFSNLLLLYPKMGALVAQECGVPGAQVAQAMFAPPEPPLTPVKAVEMPQVVRRFAVPQLARRQAPRKRKGVGTQKKLRRKAA
jgi:hypothetical protein